MRDLERQVLQAIQAEYAGLFPKQIPSEVMDKIAMQAGISVTRLRKIIADVRQQLGRDHFKYSADALLAAWKKPIDD